MAGVSAFLLGVLSLILNLLLYSLLALVSLVVLALLLPVHARFRAQPDLTLSDDWEPSGPLPWQADIRWGWVLVRLALTGDGARVAGGRIELAGIGIGLGGGGGRRRGIRPEAESQSKAASKAKAARKARPRKKARPRLTAALIRDLLREGRRTLARIWRMLGLRISGEVMYGFPDPALTGITLGALHAGLKPRALKVTPEFLDPCVRGRVEGEARFVLAQGLAALIALAFARPVRRLWMPKIRIGRRRSRQAA